jgi:hypothetical protein
VTAHDQREGLVKLSLNQECPGGAAVVVVWSTLTAVFAAATWAGVYAALANTLFPPIGRVNQSALTTLTLQLGTASAGVGLVVGVLGGFLCSRNRPANAIALGLGGLLFGAVGGGLMPRAIYEAEGTMGPLASSSIAWAIAGALAGIVATAVFQWTREPVEKPDEDDEPREPEPPAATWKGTDRRRLSLIRLLRFFPLLSCSAAALVAAALTFPSQAALALFVMGCLGFATSSVLMNHDRRLIALERKAASRRS